MIQDNNNTHTTLKQQFSVPFEYPLHYTRGSLAPENLRLANLIVNHADHPVILPVLDDGLLKGQPRLPEQLKHYAAAHSLNLLPPLIATGGEACKQNTELLERIYDAVVEHRIDRHAYILVAGGGAVIDAVGYAAATAHRGIRLIRMPSTVLAQNDAAVGVKNAINYAERKNFLGTFVPPYAVISDFDWLDSLEARDKRAGIAEAIKVALIKSPEFFQWLYEQRQALARFEHRAVETMIIEGARWHLDHIAHQGDPFEMGSARPLDFGHWSAHKLEALSQHSLRHGEAVAIGIAMDSIYSHKAGRLSDAALAQILTLLTDLGFSLHHPALDRLNVHQALDEFREHLGGRLCITLLNGLGDAEEVTSIDADLMDASKQSLSQLPGAA